MSKKTKKVVGLLLSLTLLLAMSVNVFAAGSATSYGAVKGATAVDANGNKINVTLAAPTKTPSIADAKAALGGDFVEGMYIFESMDVKTDVKPATISFQVPVVKSTTKVGVLHFNGTTWEKVASKAGNGTVTATFSSLSPVAIVVDKNTQADVAPAKTGGSPKTGEFGTTSVLAVIAVLAIGGAVVSYRKREEVR